MNSPSGDNPFNNSTDSPIHRASKMSPVAMARGIVGAVIGGVVGYFGTSWLADQGLYAIVLPGALAGLCCGYMSRGRSIPLGCVCAVIGLLAGCVTEALLFPFIADESLGYFFRNLGDLKSATKVLLAIGGLSAGWFGMGRER